MVPAEEHLQLNLDKAGRDEQEEERLWSTRGGKEANQLNIPASFAYRQPFTGAETIRCRSTKYFVRVPRLMVGHVRFNTDKMQLFGLVEYAVRERRLSCRNILWSTRLRLGSTRTW